MANYVPPSMRNMMVKPDDQELNEKIEIIGANEEIHFPTMIKTMPKVIDGDAFLAKAKMIVPEEPKVEKQTRRARRAQVITAVKIPEREKVQEEVDEEWIDPYSKKRNKNYKNKIKKQNEYLRSLERDYSDNESTVWDDSPDLEVTD